MMALISSAEYGLKHILQLPILESILGASFYGKSMVLEMIKIENLSLPWEAHSTKLYSTFSFFVYKKSTSSMTKKKCTFVLFRKESNSNASSWGVFLLDWIYFLA